MIKAGKYLLFCKKSDPVFFKFSNRVYVNWPTFWNCRFGKHSFLFELTMFVSTNFIAKYFEIIDKGVFILAMSAICILSSSRNKKARSHDRVTLTLWSKLYIVISSKPKPKTYLVLSTLFTYSTCILGCR